MVEIKIPLEKFQNLLKFSIDNNINLREVFTFNVKEKIYGIPKVYAILSSTILDEFQNNKTISSFNIDIDDPNNLFKNIISLFQGESIVIYPDEYLFYIQIISILKIESIYPQLQTLFNKELKFDNCIDCLNYKHSFNFSTNDEVDFISKNFSEFKTKDILNIEKDTLIQILNNKSLIIKNEDNFFRLIEEINQNNQDYKFMFDYIHYENLSKDILNDSTFKNMKFNSDIVKKLILIIQEYHHHINEFLIQNKFKKEYQETFVEFCFFKNDIKLIESLLKLKDFDFNLKYDNQTLLIHAIEKGNIEIIKLLINNPKVDINQKLNYGWFEKNALIYAIEKGNLDIVKLLLNNPKIDINQKLIIIQIQNSQNNQRNDEKNALIHAIEKGNLDIIKLLLNNPKIDINQKLSGWNGEKNALAYAIEKGNHKIIQLLVKHNKIIISFEENEKLKNLRILNLTTF